MTSAMILRRQAPIVQLITNGALVAYSVIGVLLGPGMVFPALCGAIGLLLLRNSIANLKGMKIEVNTVGVYNNGLLIVEAKDVAKAESIGSNLVVHTSKGVTHFIRAFDISRKGRRQFVFTLNDNQRQSTSDEARRTEHVQ